MHASNETCQEKLVDSTHEKVNLSRKTCLPVRQRGPVRLIFHWCSTREDKGNLQTLINITIIYLISLTRSNLTNTKRHTPTNCSLVRRTYGVSRDITRFNFSPQSKRCAALKQQRNSITLDNALF
jgi:hypothetical protein